MSHPFWYSWSTMAKVRDILTQLQNTEPVEPRGWFRWLHNHFLGRYRLNDANLEEQLAKQGWADLSRSLANLSARKRSALIPVIARHAWSVGRVGLTELAAGDWEELRNYERRDLLNRLA